MPRKRLLIITGYLLLVTVSTGCAALRKITPPVMRPKGPAGTGLLPQYSGLKASIAVADFEIKTVTVSAEVGLGLRKALVAVLTHSNRFSVVERSSASQGLPQADLIIAAAITEFNPRSSGGKSGVGGGGGVGSGVLGALLSGTLNNKAHLSLDIRIIEASSSKVLAQTQLQGQASDAHGSGAVMREVLGNGLSGGVSGYANTPMEKAMRICVAEAVRYIAQAVPAPYYKYR